MLNKTTNELITLLTQAMSVGNQELINMYAYELTTRLFVPKTGITFEELLDGFGYRNIENNPNQISIEEYMRGRKNG